MNSSSIGRRAAAIWFSWALVMASGAEPNTRPAAPGNGVPAGINWSREREFWSFQRPQRKTLPPVVRNEWPAQPIDHFILARLEARGLTPSPEADRRTLIRRLSFDLTGLPPAPADVERLVADARPDAWEQLVDRWLSGPRFGERLASLWLPLVRYAEDQAHQVGDDTRFFYPNAYRYRDWVIAAFNRDLRYDLFLQFQLAADRLSAAGEEDLVALGLLGLGPKYYNRERIDVMADEWEDRVDTVCRSMLGLTVACARCHDHKYEPITMRDYYGMAGVFASTRMSNRGAAGWEEKKDIVARKMQPDTLHVVAEGKVEDLPVFLRGNPERKGPVAERRFLEILSEDGPGRFEDGSGRRDLAKAIGSDRNPLTARVWVNRIWALCFGAPLVGSPSNFGHSGQPPRHPELLDDLAARFMEGGWSTKKLVRELVLSRTYRQTSRADAATISADPGNELLGRMSRRRLSVEQWRDGILSVTGELELGDTRSQELAAPENRRRTVFARISRLQLDEILAQFDYPDANVHAERRNSTTTALQKLFVLNSPFMLERSRALASRLQASGGAADADRVRLAYGLLFGRPPLTRELELGLQFLGNHPSEGSARWEKYAQVLLASNEWMHLE